MSNAIPAKNVEVSIELKSGIKKTYKNISFLTRAKVIIFNGINSDINVEDIESILIDGISYGIEKFEKKESATVLHLFEN